MSPKQTSPTDPGKTRRTKAERDEHANYARRSVARKRAEGIVRAHLWIIACDKAHFERLAEASRNRHLAKNEDTVDRAASVTGRLWSREKCKTKPLPHLFDWQVWSASLVYSWKNCVSDCFDHRVLSRTGVMLPSVVGASAATLCQVQKRFPCAYLRRRPQNGGLGTSGFTASSGTASRVGTSVNQRHRARPNSFLFVFDDKGYLGK